jgi:hypothetical protein
MASTSDPFPLNKADKSGLLLWQVRVNKKDQDMFQLISFQDKDNDNNSLDSSLNMPHNLSNHSSINLEELFLRDSVVFHKGLNNLSRDSNKEASLLRLIQVVSSLMRMIIAFILEDNLSSPRDSEGQIQMYKFNSEALHLHHNTQGNPVETSFSSLLMLKEDLEEVSQNKVDFLFPSGNPREKVREDCHNSKELLRINSNNMCQIPS